MANVSLIADSNESSSGQINQIFQIYRFQDLWRVGGKHGSKTVDFTNIGFRFFSPLESKEYGYGGLRPNFRNGCQSPSS